jgi:hypothetical protein
MNINNNEPITIWLSPVECAAGMKPVGWELGLRVRKPRKDNWNPGLTQDPCLQGRVRIGKEERRLKQALDMVARFLKTNHLFSAYCSRLQFSTIQSEGKALVSVNVYENMMNQTQKAKQDDATEIQQLDGLQQLNEKK